MHTTRQRHRTLKVTNGGRSGGKGTTTACRDARLVGYSCHRARQLTTTTACRDARLLVEGCHRGWMLRPSLSRGGEGRHRWGGEPSSLGRYRSRGAHPRAVEEDQGQSQMVMGGAEETVVEEAMLQ